MLKMAVKYIFFAEQYSVDKYINEDDGMRIICIQVTFVDSF